MQTIKLTSHIGDDGTLKLDVPVGLTNTDVEVLIVIQPSPPETTATTPEDRGWPPGFFEATAGRWEGEPLVRGDQGDYEDRDKLQ